MSDAARRPLRGALRATTWGLVFFAAVQLAGALLGDRKLAADAVQAALAEWGAGLAGVAWTTAPGTTWRDPARRAATGAAYALAGAALVVVVALASRGARLGEVKPLASALLLGLLVAALNAVRDELLLRGVVLRVTEGLPRLVAIAACAAAGVASFFGRELASPDPSAGAPLAIGAAIAALEAAAFAALWLRDRGAWLAVGAHAMWLWATGPLVQGGLLDLRAAPTLWGGGDAGLRRSLVVVACLVPLAFGAISAARVRSNATLGE